MTAVSTSRPSFDLPEPTLRIGGEHAHVPGLGPVAGAALAGHPGIDKVSFTGSPRVGKQIQSLAGDTFRKVTLELGGKAAQLIFDDADLDAAMPWIAMGNFYHQGQVCAAGTRVLVHESLVDRVVEGLVEAAANARIGDPFLPTSTMGSIVNQRQLDQIPRYIDIGREEGAELVTGGARLWRPGYFVEPTVFRGSNDLTIAREEIFGPVATVIGFETTEEAVRLANETRYGLNAMVYTSDLSRAVTVTEQLRVGTVWVNGWGVPIRPCPGAGARAAESAANSAAAASKPTPRRRPSTSDCDPPFAPSRRRDAVPCGSRRRPPVRGSRRLRAFRRPGRESPGR
ncbi:aldehyde dehydrogenase family protein [Nocardia gamkensis]|uniref:aldehyde dehydrogenase family protein n=1 Tax=Nocardia gamkensis TaxID=352869 RepID=UPI000A601B4F|nr:aldehyde dehydrogenase family protein [Nocardia gamkensis]NQE69317.1 putative aldehyde dehydrogenase-like protein [Nocardia gamkensis]